MAEINNVIAEASQDLQTIEDFVNLPSDSEVYPRLLPSVNVGTLAGTRQAIFEAGGLPATPFNTKSQLLVSSLVDGTYALVTDDANDSNNGYYKKQAGVWSYLKYNPVSQSKAYTDSAKAELYKKTVSAFATFALMYASPLVDDSFAVVTDDPVLKSNGFYQKRAGTWTMVDMSPMYKARTILATDDLNDLRTTGEYHKIGSGDINMAKNYPVKYAGALTVSAAATTMLVQTYKVFFTGATYVRAYAGTAFTAWSLVASASDIPTVESKMNFKKTATAMSVYFSMPSGNKLEVGFNHILIDNIDFSNPTSGADLWRLLGMYKCDAAFGRGITIVDAGEIEFATQHTENTQAEGVTKDHVGGYHGDERLTDVKFFINGIDKPADFVQSSLAAADEIQVVQHSVIYFQNTTRPLCDHIKNITFKDGVINVKQVMDFKYETVQLDTAWTAMLPINRTGVTDRSSRSDDYFLQVDDNTAASFIRRFSKAENGAVIKQWHTTSGISSETTLIKVAGFNASENVYISNGGGYNKLYVSAQNGAASTPLDVPVGTKWQVEAEYKIKC